MNTISKFLMVAALGLLLVGCKTPNNYIVVTSGTTVGFDVSQAPASSTPQATLAYKRVELALVPVPTNGVAPDVLMDFTFKTAIFSSAGGIHSRVAVGEHATTQIPAAIMMAKDSNGNVSTNLNAVPVIPLLLKTNK